MGMAARMTVLSTKTLAAAVLAGRLLLSAAQSAPVLTALPIQGLRAGDIHDTFHELRGSKPHEAVRGTIVRLFLSKPGGNTIY
jgi:hypothetical protein